MNVYFTKELILSIYGKIKTVMELKSVRINRKKLDRLDEDYTYKIMDNFNIDKIDDKIKPLLDSGTGQISISDMRELVLDDDWEMQDSLYPIIRSGTSYSGSRRSRVADSDQKGMIPTELLEIDVNTLVPDIIYMLMGEKFDSEKYYSQFTERQIDDMNNLFICMMNKTISDSEKSRLKSYLKKDKTTERFYRTLKDKSPHSMKEYKHPNPMDIVEPFETAVIVVKDELDLIYYYIKSMMLPILLIIISRINSHNSMNNKYRIIVRSISIFRLIVERDLGCNLSPTYCTATGVVLRPKLTVLKTIHRTKQEAIEEINKLSQKDFESMRNKHFGSIVPNKENDYEEQINKIKNEFKSK